MTELQHHIQLGPQHLEGNDGLGRYVLVPGDPSRAARIASHFSGLETITTARRLDAHLGQLDGTDGKPIDVLVIPTGIGAPSAEVVLHELMECGARRLVRVGSCGTCSPAIAPGQVVIATGAVRDESTSLDYAPIEYPALAHPAAVAAMVMGAISSELAEHTFCGICHSKASLYAREFGHGPRGEANLDYNQWLKRCGVIASEMEASILFVMAATRPAVATPIAHAAPSTACQAVAVLGVFGSDQSDMKVDPDTCDLAEERAITLALEGIRQWAAAASSDD
jgi:uridine phosphorylase